MKQPTLKEVKKHFKKALIVESPVSSFDGKIKIKSIRWYDKEKEKYIACDCDNSVGIITLWGYDTGYSKILTYKEKRFSITESQINEIYYFIEHQENAEKFKSWFPECFKQKVDELKKEAIQKGFVDGALYEHKSVGITRKVYGDSFSYDENYNQLRINGFCIWDNGKWTAEIIPTITLSEAEQQLGKKIIV